MAGEVWSLRRLAPCVAVGALVLPFHPFWLDHEVARRGIAMVVAAVAVLAAPWWWRGGTARAALPLVALLAWALVRCGGATNPSEALLACGYLAALGAAFAAGVACGPRALRAAAVPVGVVVALYGLAQAVGLDWPAGYAHPEQPVSTLGNRNVAAEFVTVAAVLAAGSAARGSRAAAIAAAAMVGYLVVNGSRGALGGTALGLAVLAFAAGPRRPAGAGEPRRSRRPVLVIAAAGIAVGLAVDRGRALLAAPAPLPTATAARPVPSTIDVRFALWRGAADLVAAAPIAGIGPAQFRYEYPRVRRAEEIELSTFGRRFEVFASTAHNDLLEQWIELGLVGLCAWLALLAGVWRGAGATTRDRLRRCAPLLALALPALVRSPFTNAPVAALALAYAGALRGRGLDATRRDLRRLLPALPAAAVLCWAGIGPLAGELAAAAYTETGRDGGPRPGDLTHLDEAVFWHGSEPRLRSLRVRHLERFAEPLFGGDMRSLYDAARDDLRVLAEIDPHNTASLLLTARLAARAGDGEAARAALTHALELDPRHPEATLQAAALLCQAGDVARGIATLYAAPHPRLRETLAAQLRQLALDRRAHGDPRGAALLHREHRFVAAVDAVLRDPGGDGADLALRELALAPGITAEDPGLRILTARRVLAIGSAADAAALVPPAGPRPERSRLRLLEPVTAELRSVPAWARWLGPPGGDG